MGLIMGQYMWCSFDEFMYEDRGDLQNCVEFKFIHRSNLRPKGKNIKSLLKLKLKGLQ